MIFNLTEVGGVELADRLMVHPASSQRSNGHTLSSKTLSEMLKAKGVRHEVRTGPTKIEVDDFIMKREHVPTANHVVTFFLQTKYDELPADLQGSIYELVRERSSKDPVSGKYMFSHPTAMILIHAD